jgi:hypothetical protein
VGIVESALHRIGIGPSERALCGWAGLCLALLGATAFALLNSSETLFLKRVGVTGIASRALADADRPRALPRILLVLALMLFPLWGLLQTLPVPVVFGAFVLAARQVLALGLMVVWLALADLVTGRQAKRLFAPLSAGVTVGGIAGSFGSDPVSRWVGVEGLLLVCAGLLAAAALAAMRLHAAGTRHRERGPRADRRPSRAPAPKQRTSAARIWRISPLFRLLLAALLCGGVLSPVLYFEFSYVADAATTGADGEQRLLSLYAQFRGWLNVAMLVAQLWLSGRLYQRFGLPLSLALWPASYLMGFGWLGIQPSLAAGVTALGAGRLAEDGIGGSALRVLFNLFPEQLRSRAASLLEGPVNRLGGVLGNSCVLLALGLGAVPFIAWAAIPLAALWLGAALALWRIYPSLLLRASADRSLGAAGEDTAKLLDPGTVRALGAGLADADPRMCRAAVDLVTAADPAIAAEVLAGALEAAPASTRPLLVDALHRLVEPLPAGSLRSGRATAALARVLREPGHLAAEERADLLQTYARLTGASAAEGSEATGSIEVLQRALGDREAAVRLAAIAELHRRGRPPPGVGDLDTVLSSSLAGGDVLMRRSARKELRAMLLSTEPDDRWRARLALLAERLDQRADRAETAEALVEVGRRHDGAVLACSDEVLRWVDDRDPRVRAAVLRFVGHAGLSQQLRRLLAALGSRHAEVSSAARDGLVGLGAEVAQPLLAEIESGAPARREAVVSVLRKLELEAGELEALYARQLESARRAVVLRAALDGQDPSGLMLRRLEERVEEAVATLLACAAVLEDDDRIGQLERRLRRAPDERSRDILVEALEAVLPAIARVDLVPLLEADPWAQRGREGAALLGHRLPSAETAWSDLLEDPDPLSWRLARMFAPQAVEERLRMGDVPSVLDPMDVAVRLQATPAFGRLPTQQLVGLAEVLEEMRLEPGEPVFAEGDEGDGIYFVYEGEVEMHRGEQVLSRSGPGAFFGELSTLDGVPRTLAARAGQPTVLLRLDREELFALMENQPELGIGLSQFLSMRVRSLQDRLDSR